MVAQTVKNLPAMEETKVRSLGWEDSLKKEMATHSSILAWRIPWAEEPDGLQFMGSQRVGHDWATNTFTLILKKRNNFNITLSPSLDIQHFHISHKIRTCTGILFNQDCIIYEALLEHFTNRRKQKWLCLYAQGSICILLTKSKYQTHNIKTLQS